MPETTHPDISTLKRKVATLEWDLANLTNETIRAQKQRELDRAKADLTKLKKEETR